MTAVAMASPPRPMPTTRICDPAIAFLNGSLDACEAGLHLLFEFLDDGNELGLGDVFGVRLGEDVDDFASLIRRHADAPDGILRPQCRC